MNNEQIAAARKALFDYPALKVSIVEDGGNTILKPVSNANPSIVGAAVTITPGMGPTEVERVFRASCKAMQL